MKLVTTIKLLPENKSELLIMMEQFNIACNALSKIAFNEKLFGWLALQRRVYHWLRHEYGLSGAQAVVAVRKVAYVYSNKSRRNKVAKFSLRGAIPIYQHSYKRDNLIKLYGLTIPFQARSDVPLSGKYEAKLIYDHGKFMLHQVIEVPEGTSIEPTEIIGCDIGMVNLLADSDGEVHSGDAVRELNQTYNHRRRNLQKKQTRSSKRKLQTIRGKQSRIQRDINHCISKQVVTKAKDTLRGIALEELGGIRERITVRRRQRSRFSNWAFAQLRAFIEYKAKLAGIPVFMVDPRNSSRTCPACGHVDKHNRPNQSTFSCVSCGFAGLADTIAALNIRARARGDAPMVAA